VIFRVSQGLALIPHPKPLFPTRASKAVSNKGGLQPLLKFLRLKETLEVIFGLRIGYFGLFEFFVLALRTHHTKTVGTSPSPTHGIATGSRRSRRTK
jgi:hypothetical protein